MMTTTALVCCEPLIMPSDRQAPGRARDYVRRVLAACDLGSLADDACTVVSELAANAVIHVHHGIVIVEAAALQPTAVIAVWDSSLVPPKPRHAADSMISGRGLAIVDTLTHGQWGWAPRPFGKIVYAVLGG